MKIYDFLKRNYLILLSLCVAYFILAGAISKETTPDEGLFEAFGFSITQGKTLYTDLFDHKPPGVFGINAAILNLFGKSETGIGIGVCLFGLLHVFLIFRIIELLTKNKNWAFLTAILFSLVQFRYALFGSGNFTETYAAASVSAAVCFFILFYQTKKNWYLFLSGLFFGCAPWIKEPFTVAVFPYAVFLFYYSIRYKNIKSILSFGLGYAIVSLVSVLFLFKAGIFDGYLETLEYNNAYRKFVKTMNYLIMSLKNTKMWHFNHFGLGVVLPSIFLISMAFGSLLKKDRLVWRLLVGQLILEIIVISIIQNDFAHYWLQLLPTATVVFVLGLFWASELLTRFSFLNKFKTYSFAALALLIGLYFYWNKEDIKFNYSLKKTFQSAIVKTVVEDTARDTKSNPKLLVISKYLGPYYIKTKCVVPVKHGVPYGFHWIDLPKMPGIKRYQMDSAILDQHPPKYLISNETVAEIFAHTGFMPWILSHYDIVQEEQHPDGYALFLWKLKIKK